jgi:uncharacterized protein (TIGR03089 family)
VLAASLRPLGGRFQDVLPAGVTDYGAVVLGQPDAFTAYDAPLADDVAWQDPTGRTTQRELLEEAAATSPVPPSGRLLTDVNPCSRAGLVTLVAPVLLGASTVWVRRPDEAAWSSRAGQERATDLLRS